MTHEEAAARTTILYASLLCCGRKWWAENDRRNAHLAFDAAHVVVVKAPLEQQHLLDLIRRIMEIDTETTDHNLVLRRAAMELPG
jgi:hypothetical protein